MGTFYDLKSPKWKKPLNISEKVFYKQVLEFHRPSKIFMPDIWASKSLVPNVHCTRATTGSSGCFKKVKEEFFVVIQRQFSFFSEENNIQ